VHRLARGQPCPDCRSACPGSVIRRRLIRKTEATVSERQNSLSARGSWYARASELPFISTAIARVRVGRYEMVAVPVCRRGSATAGPVRREGRGRDRRDVRGIRAEVATFWRPSLAPGARLVAIHRSELGLTVPIRRRASSERGTTGNPRIPPSVDRLNSAASASSRVLADPRRAERRPS
jgi:hypothetical protein